MQFSFSKNDSENEHRKTEMSMNCIAAEIKKIGDYDFEILVCSGTQEGFL